MTVTCNYCGETLIDIGQADYGEHIDAHHEHAERIARNADRAADRVRRQALAEVLDLQSEVLGR